MFIGGNTVWRPQQSYRKKIAYFIIRHPKPRPAPGCHSATHSSFSTEGAKLFVVMIGKFVLFASLVALVMVAQAARVSHGMAGKSRTTDSNVPTDAIGFTDRNSGGRKCPCKCHAQKSKAKNNCHGRRACKVGRCTFGLFRKGHNCCDKSKSGILCYGPYCG